MFLWSNISINATHANETPQCILPHILTYRKKRPINRRAVFLSKDLSPVSVLTNAGHLSSPTQGPESHSLEGTAHMAQESGAVSPTHPGQVGAQRLPTSTVSNLAGNLDGSPKGTWATKLYF